MYLELNVMALPIVEDVMDARRPRTHENGSEIAIALLPIFPTCRLHRSLAQKHQESKVNYNETRLTKSCSRKQK